MHGSVQAVAVVTIPLFPPPNPPPPTPTSLGLWLPDILFSLCPGAGYCHLTKYISATSKTWNRPLYFLEEVAEAIAPKIPAALVILG